MSENVKKPDAGTMSKRVRAVLFVSLALNLLIVGLVAGVMLRHDREGPMVGKRGLQNYGFGPFAGAFSKADRAAVGHALATHQGTFRKNREDVREATVGILRTLNAEPFDAEQLRAAMRSQHQLLSERQVIAINIFVERVVAMDADERRQYLRRLERSLKKDFRRH